MLDCNQIIQSLDEYSRCETNEFGNKITTHVMYPSFEPVSVFVVSRGDLIEVHDGRGAFECASLHAIEGGGIRRACIESAQRFSCNVENEFITITVENVDWLYSAITSVANASSLAAHKIVTRKSTTREQNLIVKTKHLIDEGRWGAKTKTHVSILGKSGKSHKFDLSVTHGETIAIIDAVIPHHSSIASKYMAFSDADFKRGTFRYALYDGDLASEDKTLIANVADLIPFEALSGTNGKFLLS